MPDPSVIPRELAALFAERGWPGDGGPPRITRLAAYGLLWRDGRVLLCRTAAGHLGVGRWTLPGGGIVFGESPQAGAIREVEEETGLVAEITGSPVIDSDSGTWPLGDPPIPFHQIRFVYPMRVVGGMERVEEGGSTDAFEWFAPDALRTIPIVRLVSIALGVPMAPDDDEMTSVLAPDLDGDSIEA
ncbi:MAG TPA: NUDIX domain-containing protein [Candidatus Limnocylindrales bacterium]|nr:NUDIX domain-containing protein [Candidatus Limnocylindrales bacterium]